MKHNNEKLPSDTERWDIRYKICATGAEFVFSMIQ
jgi:hypothetical protein